MLLILLITVAVRLTYRCSYFVGFRDSMPFKVNERSGKPLEAWLPDFDLAKAPQKNFKWRIDYKGNMAGWKL